MSGPHSDDDGEALDTRPERAPALVRELQHADLDTLPRPPAGWSIGLDAPPEDSGGGHGDGLESAVLLARARQKLLGWQDTPVVVGRYKVLERIGQGGMGVVYAAHDDELDRDVAIKILRSELAPGTAGRQRLVREAQATAKLSHPNVVHVYEVGQQGEQVFMAMELVRGRTLRVWCEAQSRPWRELVAMFVQAGEGLVAAHEHGIVHRDFKPDNVLIGEGPSGARPQIVDFGLARASNDSTTTGEHPVLRDLDITRTGTVVGTPAYMAPEQLARGEPDARSDQFSFCVALHEALYRRRPFAGSTYTELADSLTAGIPIEIDDKRDVPATLHAVVMRGLAHDPAARHPNMRALLDALTQLLQPPPRSRAWIAIPVAVLAAALVLALVFRPAARPSDTVAVEPTVPTVDPWAAIVAASDLPPVVETPLVDDPAGMSVQRLRNGLTLYVAHRPLEPMVAVGLAVRAGPSEEGASSVGMAELVESAVMWGTDRVGTRDAVLERPHLVFQHRLIERLPEIREPAARELVLQTIAASERASAPLSVRGEIFGVHDALGGRGSLIIERHGTLFAVKLPAHRIGAWLAVVGEAVARPVFRQFLGSCAERLAFVGGFGADNPGDAARSAALAPATGIHRDRELAISELLEVPLAQAMAFHRDYYRPNNAALFFVGDITVAQAVAIAEQHMGSWEPRAIPELTIVDEPLPPSRAPIEAPISGGPLVTLSWPTPPLGTPEYAQLELLVTVLRGRVGLLGAGMREQANGWGAYLGDTRDLHVIGIPRPDQPLEQVERAMVQALDTIADGRLDAAQWTAALAEAELERLAWARGPGELMMTASESFFARAPWSTTAHAIASAAPTREEIVAAAQLLRARNHLVSYERAGKVATPTAPELPGLPVPQRHEGRSAFVEAIVAAPAPQVEPRFLVEGSHFVRTDHGAGQVISAELAGPLFWLTWVYPIGADEDPWACEAMRVRLGRLDLAGLDVQQYCTSADTRIEIVGPAARFDTAMPPLLAWLQADDLAGIDVEDELRGMIAARRSDREQPFLELAWAETWALFGEHTVDARLPSDRELLAHGPREIPRALVQLQQVAPDVLYVGPHAERLRAVLPAARARGGGPPPQREYRVREHPEIMLVDDPSHDRVSVRVSLPWLAQTPVEQLAATLHDGLVLEQQHLSGYDPDFDHLGYELAWSPGRPLAIGVGFRVAPDEVAAAIRSGREALHRRPTELELAAGRRRLEGSFRAKRWSPKRIPELVYSWGREQADPRVAQWLALPSLRLEDVMRYHDRADATIPAVVVIGDLRALDLDALAELGTLVRVDDEQFMRDVSMLGYRTGLGELMDD